MKTIRIMLIALAILSLSVDTRAFSLVKFLRSAVCKNELSKYVEKPDDESWKDRPARELSVSIDELEAMVAARLKEGISPAEIDLGFNDVRGFVWDAARGKLFLLAAYDPDCDPLTAEKWAAVFQLAKSESFFLSLDPKDPTDPDSRLIVRVSPVVAGSPWLVLLLRADVTIKDQAFSHLIKAFAERIKEDPRTTENGLTCARVVFVSGRPNLEMDETGGKLTIRFDTIPVLMSQQDVISRVSTSIKRLPEDHPLARFTASVNGNYRKLEKYEVFRNLAKLNRLVLCAQLLLKAREVGSISRNFQFWLALPTETYSIPVEELRGIPSVTLKKTFFGRPWSPYEFGSLTRVHLLYGGIVFGFTQYLNGLWDTKDPPADGSPAQILDVGSSLGLETSSLNRLNVNVSAMNLDVMLPRGLFSQNTTAFSPSLSAGIVSAGIGRPITGSMSNHMDSLSRFSREIMQPMPRLPSMTPQISTGALSMQSLSNPALNHSTRFQYPSIDSSSWNVLKPSGLNRLTEPTYWNMNRINNDLNRYQPFPFR